MYCQAHHLTLTRSNALLRSWARGEYCEGREAAQTKALLKVELTIIGNDEEDVARAEDLEDDGSGRRVRLRLRAADEVQARVHHVSGISPCPSRGNEHISSGRVQPTAFLDEGRPGPVWAGPPGDRDFHVSDLENSNNCRTGGVLREHAERVRQELRGDITRIAAPLGADSSSTSDAHPTIRVEHMRDGTWGDQGVCELPVRTSGRQRSHNLSEGQHSSRDRFLTPAGERISSASFVGGATACAGGGGPVIGLATAAGNGHSDYSGERGCCENGVAQAHQQKEPLECRKYSGRAAVDGSSANVVPRTLGGVRRPSVPRPLHVMLLLHITGTHATTT